jgi:inner membrane protein
MYFLTHLLVGILLGILLAFIFRDTLLILPCAIGSILPDLIDKPVGILFFYQTIGSGRIYCHTLIFAALFLCIGTIVYLRYKRSGIVLIGIASGILTHQLLDAMWLSPVNWLWPALGPFIGNSRHDYLWSTFWSEITNPAEWVAGGIILAFILMYMFPQYSERYFSFSREKGEGRHSLPLILIIIAMSVFVLLLGISNG